ncbi:phosphatidylserine/phosphatidylglycerophosphate/cardiolipin synthase family protein [Oceanisphaera sp. IT1-181]|uniref:phospholipase D-like domain-containing protein n=1 Tax=Oceanisphaera sp. IT1-181 TaxID=3081199 RepID=UPI0029C9EDF1|nr:phosphatidylserine/phosphatidylglycerophosphate/cardiolipin synthase family protein [Oceanisphaera sp. IT1-181]
MNGHSRFPQQSSHSAVGTGEPLKTEFTLFTEGDELYAAMARSIRAATHRVFLASYILAADEVGTVLLNELMRQSRRGLDVRVHVDALGSSSCLPLRHRRQLRAAGVRLQRFHRWSWRQPMRYNRRDHRKLLVVDGQTAYLGGFNIHREGSQRFYGLTRWRDAHACFGGILAAEAEALFDAFWCGHPDGDPLKSNEGDSRIVPNTTRRCRIQLRCTIKDQLVTASKSIWLVTPYFVPDRGLRRQLIFAARRGVDVCILTTEKTDSAPAQWAARAFYGELIENGVRIFEYTPRFLHSKVLLVDDIWGSIGTANFDYRSLFINYELTLISRSRQLISQLRETFLDDLKNSHEITLVDWKHRGFINGIYDVFGRFLRKWL